MKKALVTILLIAVVIGGWWIFSGLDDEETFKELTEETNEKIKKNVKSENKSKKALESIESASGNKLNGRVVIGESMKVLDKWPEKITFLNKIDPDWDKKTADQLNQASTYDRKLKITKRGGFIALNGDSAIYMERAFVEFKQPDGSDGSFEAVVNSETGEIELVVDKQINEELVVEDPKVKYPDPYDEQNFLASEEEVRQLEDADSDEIVESMVAEANEEFDQYEYEEEIAAQAEAIAAQDTDENHKKFVEKLQRDIASESDGD